MRITELIPESAWVVDQLLSAEECESIMDRAMEAGIVSSRAAGDIRYRNAAAIHFFDPELARQLYERIRCHLPEQIVVDENTSNDGLRHSKDNFLGTWRPCGVNERFLVSRYDALGHFGPHRDTGVVHDDNHRSLITLAAYLTDRPTGYGGATRFIRDDLDLFSREDGLITTPEEAVRHRVEADKAGKSVLFLHDLMHDGEPLKEGSPPKWLFRTDVVFERDAETTGSPKSVGTGRRV